MTAPLHDAAAADGDGVSRSDGLAVAELRVVGPAGAIVHGSSLRLAAGSTLAIVGESGSGKSMTARAISGLLAPGLSATGRMRLDGIDVDLATATETTWRAVRGRHIVLLLQDPFTSLSRSHRCGDQIAAALPVPQRRDRRERRTQVLRRLDEVGLPERVATAYPFELSGGQRQRVALAAALAAEPRLLIADEPTTALDVTTQRGILDLLDDLRRRRRMTTILITHDLRLARERADDVAVMQAGRIVESGRGEQVLGAPTHPYTVALAAAVPPLRVAAPADATAARATTVRVPIEPGAAAGDDPSGDAAPPEQPARQALVRVEALAKRFRQSDVVALAGVDLQIELGQCLAVVGESGSGKTTLARCIVGLERADGGSVQFALGPTTASARRRSRRDPTAVQIVFQDPYSALNPSMTVGAALAEALRAGGGSGSDGDIAALLALVRLPASYADRRPRALSGGERQRVAIARALAPKPRLLICDEAVSALDVSVQAQILALLDDLRAQLGLSLLFITHDLAVARQIADVVAVMHRGQIVEAGPADEVLGHPRHDYTKTLLASVPGSDAPGLTWHDGAPRLDTSPPPDHQETT